MPDQQERLSAGSIIGIFVTTLLVEAVVWCVSVFLFPFQLLLALVVLGCVIALSSQRNGRSREVLACVIVSLLLSIPVGTGVIHWLATHGPSRPY